MIYHYIDKNDKDRKKWLPEGDIESFFKTKSETQNYFLDNNSGAKSFHQK